MNFDFNEFESSIQNDSPVKTGYQQDSNYEPESERSSPSEMKEEKLPPKKKQKTGKRDVHVISSLDFTIGQTRMGARNKVKDQMICHIIQAFFSNALKIGMALFRKDWPYQVVVIFLFTVLLKVHM